jgi:diguanylate cyclase (GGDEF)-like protein
LLSPDQLQRVARRDAIRRRDMIRQVEELRRTVRFGVLGVAPVLFITGIVLAARYPTSGPMLPWVWVVGAVATGLLYPLAVRAPRRLLVQLSMAMASIPAICLPWTLAIEPKTLLSMTSSFAILPVAVPLFIGWSRNLRTGWLVAYAGALIGFVMLTGFDRLDLTQRADIAVDIAIGCLIGWCGGALLERPRLRTLENELELRRLNRVLSGHAMTDPLTDLLNRRRLETDLGLLAVSLRQVDAPCAVLMFDVDRFKQLNDELGHAAGDVALRSIAAELKHVVRGRDTVYRYGGEEFVVILPGADLEAASSVAERIRLAIEGLRIRTRLGDPEATLTISGGVAISDAPHLSWDGALRVADFALYEAKSTGRNRICSATIEGVDRAMASETEGDSSPARRAWRRDHDIELQFDEGSGPV